MKILGVGAAGCVYQSSIGEKSVAVKVIYSDISETEYMTQYRKEIAALSLVKHASIAKILEFGMENNKPYIVSEFATGVSVSELIRSGPLSKKTILAIAKGITSALVEVHRHGYIHRDIKPDNILVSELDTVKLIDFGLAVKSDSIDSESNQETVGTLTYCSPEQAGTTKFGVDGRSDLYSLGILLYECAAGSPPFKSENVNELLSQHLNKVPERITKLNFEIGPVLGAIIEKLIEKEPGNRFENAHQALSDLNSLHELELDFDRTGQIDIGKTNAKKSVRAKSPLVGRENEMGFLNASWKEFNHGKPQFVIVEGESGLGKTRLCDEFLKKIEDEKTVIFKAKCHALEFHPHGPIAEIIKSTINLFKDFDSDRRSLLISKIEDIQEVLLYAFPEFNSIFQSKLTGNQEDRFGAESTDTAIVEYFFRLPEILKMSLTIYLDDLQWLEPRGLAILQNLTKDALEGKIFVLGAVRGEAEYTDLRTHLKSLSANLDKKWISLRPLTAKDVLNILTLTFDKWAPPEKLVEHVSEITEGNPYVIEQYIRALFEEEVVTFDKGQYGINDQLFTSISLPTNALELISRKIKQLSVEASNILNIASLAGSIFETNFLKSLPSLGEKVVSESLLEGIRFGLIEEIDGHNFRFMHDKVQEALISSMDESKKRQIHGLLANALESKEISTLEDTFSIANHYQRCDLSLIDSAKAFTRTFDAGNAAVRVHDYPRAVEFLSFAEGLADQKQSSELHSEIFHLLGIATHALGNHEQAVQYCRKSLTLCSEPLKRAKIRIELITIFVLVEAKLNEAWSEIRMATEEAGMKLPSSKFGIWLFAISKFLFTFPLVFFNIRPSTIQEKKKARLTVLAKIIVLMGYFGFLNLKRDISLISYLVGRHTLHLLGDSRITIEMLSSTCMFWANIGNRKNMDIFAKRALSVAEKERDPVLLATAKMDLVFGLQFLGDSKASQVMGFEVISKLGIWFTPALYFRSTCDLICNLWIRGYSQEALQRVLPALIRAKETNASTREILLTIFGSVQYSILGDMANSAKLKKQALDLQMSHRNFMNTPFMFSQLYTGFAALFLEELDFKEDFEDLVQKFKKSMPSPGETNYHSKAFYVFVARSRLILYQNHRSRDNKAKFIQSLKDLKKVSKLPTYGCHFHIIKAGYLTSHGKYAEAFKELDIANKQAQFVDSQWGLYEVHLAKARIAVAMKNDSLCKTSLVSCLDIANRFGWRSRIGKLQKEFEKEMDLLEGNEAEKEYHKSKATRSSKDKLYSEALLKVSLASSGTFDANTQAKNALDELINALGAQRAFLLTYDEKTDKLELRAGRAENKIDLPEVIGYSKTIISRVKEQKQSILLSSADEQGLTNASSIIANNLKSILAAPMMYNGNFRGVVYADSQITKGLFGEEDLNIFTAIINHITIAFETARFARIEMEQAVVEKDLELTAAVQTLFFPEFPSFRNSSLEIEGVCRSVAKCGGDWWWHEAIDDSKFLIVSADVTGHGSPAAMVTAVVATSIRNKIKRLKTESMETLLFEVNAELVEIIKSRYFCTLFVGVVNSEDNSFTTWFMGSPQVIVQAKAAKSYSIGEMGSPLGHRTDEFAIGSNRVELNPGDRIYVYSDGLFELRSKNPDFQQWTERRLVGFLEKLYEFSPVVTREKVINHLGKLAEQCEPEDIDDMTLVIIDYKRPLAS